MQRGAQAELTETRLERFLQGVRALMAERWAESPLGPIAEEMGPAILGGKMLRARLVGRVSPATGAEPELARRVAAAVEFLHAGSLLHDDVIDGARRRRGQPAFWVQRGVGPAVLVGDLLFFLGLEVVREAGDGRLLEALVEAAGEVCAGESEQEFLLERRRATWEACVRVARRKTGALFGFAAYALAGDNLPLARALRRAGMDVGTAYQLSDDLLDAAGSEALADKTLGSDRARGKATIAHVSQPPGLSPGRFIKKLCASATRKLEAWPAVQRAWREYLLRDLEPVLRKNLAAVRPANRKRRAR